VWPTHHPICGLGPRAHPSCTGPAPTLTLTLTPTPTLTLTLTLTRTRSLLHPLLVQSRQGSVRRTIDLAMVRAGLMCQMLLAATCCTPPVTALSRLLCGYVMGVACFAAGRIILTVRNRRWADGSVYFIFAHLGNLLILPFALGASL
jgi:hypothetical protein